MTEFDEQVRRIKHKLLDAKKADRELKVFGADSHKYYVSQPAKQNEISEFESRYDVQLPDCYKAFITQVGNGGISYENSAAGPSYGIYSLGNNVGELIYDDTEKYLKNECVIYPKMADEFWKSLTKNIEENENISDEDFKKELGKIYAGILPIGSQGCSYLHGIVLNGQYKGRVVNLDVERQKPYFTFEENFLNWYERWLDEVISNELIKACPSWFGYNKGGSEDELLTLYLSSDSIEEKKDCLHGLLNKNTLKKRILNQIERLIKDGVEPKNTLVEVICKSNYRQAKPYLIELVRTDLLSVFQFIFYYAKNKSHEWLKVIQENINRITDEETFRFCTYLLKEGSSNYGDLIVPFAKNEKENIRVQAFYALGQLKNKAVFIDIFIEGLNDNSNWVIHSTLQALSGIRNNRLLEHYRNIAQRYPIEQDYILSNLNQRLAEYGLTNKTILNRQFDEPIVKKWFEVWK